MARRRWVLRSASYAAVLLAVVATGVWLWRARAASETAISEAAAALNKYEAAASQLPLGTVTDGNVSAVLPLLDQPRALPQADEASLAPGLSQSGKLAAAGQNVYRAALGRVLLPRLVWRLESQMRDALDRPAFLYEATRVYLMLGGAGPLDSDLVRAWMRLDWEREYPGEGGATLRGRLGQHLDALLAQPLPPIALDGALVEKAALRSAAFLWQSESIRASLLRRRRSGSLPGVPVMR